jgi:hypothetical protein
LCSRSRSAYRFPCGLDRNTGLRRLSRHRPAHAVEPRQAERRDAARAEACVAQKRWAVETATGAPHWGCIAGPTAGAGKLLLGLALKGRSNGGRAIR